MIKPSTVLIHTKKKQTKHCLIDVEHNKIVRYCALGLLACNKGLIKVNGRQPSYSTILRAFRLSTRAIFKKYTCTICMDHIDSSLPFLIIHYNDMHSMTFKQIGLKLKELGF